jgi:hypothetical protein
MNVPDVPDSPITYAVEPCLGALGALGVLLSGLIVHLQERSQGVTAELQDCERFSSIGR